MESDSGPNRKRKLAVQAILDRNAEVIHALHALQRSRTDLDPSAVELSLAQEVKDNMLSLALAHPPNDLENEPRPLCALCVTWACCPSSRKTSHLQRDSCHLTLPVC
ncbi:TPA: hypothetical protein ACH3X2_007629 [Trebouxia sp. C0005]